MGSINLPYRARALMQRPIAGPFWTGLIVGGLPSAVVLSCLSGQEFSPNLLGYLLFLTPVTVFASTLGAVAGVACNWICLARRSFLTSASACVPLPLIIITSLGWRDIGLDVFSPKDFPVLIILFLIWALVVTIPASLIAVAFKTVANRKLLRSGGCRNP